MNYGDCFPNFWLRGRGVEQTDSGQGTTLLLSLELASRRPAKETGSGGGGFGGATCTLLFRRVLLDLHFLSIIALVARVPLECSGTFTVLEPSPPLVPCRVRGCPKTDSSSTEPSVRRTATAERGPLMCRSICRIVTRCSQQFDLNETSGDEHPLTPSNHFPARRWLCSDV